MKLSQEDILARLQRGEDPSDLATLTAPDDEQAALRYAAPLRWLDQELWRDVVVPRSKSEVPLASLVERGRARELPLEPGRCAIDEATRVTHVAQWDPAELQAYSGELAQLFRQRGLQLEELYHLALSDLPAAVALFETLFAQSIEAFDLSRANDLLDLFDRPDRRALVDAALRDRLTERRAHLTTNCSWAVDYYRSAGFLDRPAHTGVLRALVDGDDTDGVQLVAMGGMGKTMLLRWFLTRYCIPRGILVARVDFDEVDPAIATRYPWLVVLALAHQLNEQLPGRPFEELLDERRRLLPALYRGEGRETSAAQAELGTLGSGDALAAEVIQRYGAALASAGASPVVIVLDTLEVPLLRADLDLSPLVATMADVFRNTPSARLVLAGRHDLAEKRPELGDTLSGLRIVTMRLQAFTEEEGRAYLSEVQSITRTELVDAILAKGDLFPFTLALYADLARQDPDLTAAEVEAFDSPKLLYLIERVLERITEPDVRYVLRYGVVARQLSKRFIGEVMLPYLGRALARDPVGDDPANDPHPRLVRAFHVDGADQPVDVDALWQRLVKYTASQSWVSFVEGMGEYVSFHPDVREPMRLVLAERDVLRELHAAAAQYFRTLLAEEPGRWTRWAEEIAYHLFHAAGPDADAAWRDLLVEADRVGGAQQRADLAAAVTGDTDLVSNGGLEPGEWFNRRPIMSEATLAEAHLEVAVANLADRAGITDRDWTEIGERLAIVEQIELTAGRPLVREDRRQAVALSVRGRGGDPAALDELLALLETTDDAALLEGLVRVVLSHSGAGGPEPLRRIEERLSAMPDLFAAPELLVGLRHLLGSLLLDEGDVDAAADQAAKIAASGTHLTFLDALVLSARGRVEEAASLLATEPVHPTTIDAEGTSWLAAGLPERVLDAVRRLEGTLPSPDVQTTVQVDATRMAVRAQLSGRVAVALGDLQAGLQPLESAGLLWGQAGDRLREAETSATVALLLLEHGRVRAADDPLRLAERVAVPPTHHLWTTVRLLRARWCDRRGDGASASRLLDEVLAEFALRPHGPAALARVAVEGLAFSSAPDPGRYLALLDQALAAFRPREVAVVALGGLARCRPLTGAYAGTGALERLLDAAGQTPLPGPHDEANRMLVLADVARVLGDTRRADDLVNMAAVAPVDPASLVPLRVLEAAARVGVPNRLADGLLDIVLDRHAGRPALVVDALVAWARVCGDARWAERSQEMVELLEKLGDPTNRNAQVLLLRTEGVRNGLVDGDLGALLDVTRRLYDELGDEVSAQALGLAAPSASAVAESDPAEHVTTVVVDEGLDTLIVETDRVRREVETSLLVRPWQAGGATELVSRFAAGGGDAVDQLRDVLGAASAPGDLCLRTVTPPLAELPWERAWPARGAAVLFRGEREGRGRQRVRRAQAALAQGGYSCVPDGILGPQTENAIRQYQEAAGLPITGVVDRATEQSLARASRTDGVRVIVLQRRHGTLVRKARVAQGSASDVADAYRYAGCQTDVLEDPTFELLERVDGRIAVVHISAPFESLGGAAGLSFGSSSAMRNASEYGVETLPVTPVSMLLSRVAAGLGPIVVFDVPTPSSEWEAIRQMMLRNLFAQQLYELGAAQAVLAIGPLEDTDVFGTTGALTEGLAGVADGIDDIGALWRRLRENSGHPAHHAIALWTEDPASVVLRR